MAYLGKALERYKAIPLRHKVLDSSKDSSLDSPRKPARRQLAEVSSDRASSSPLPTNPSKIPESDPVK